MTNYSTEITEHIWVCTSDGAAKMMQHKVVEEQLHVAATMWTAQMLKEPLQHAALDIALGAVC
jgi:hypothetical protein